MEETFTDKYFCQRFKIDRATSARWRKDGIVDFLKLPNGQIRYSESHILALRKMLDASTQAFKNAGRPVKGRVIDIGIAKRGNNGGVAQNA